MSKKGVSALALAVVGGAGYYLYSAGGDSNVAQKKFEGQDDSAFTSTIHFLIFSAADAREAQAKIKGNVPGKEKEYEKRGEELAAQAGRQFDKAVCNSADAALFMLTIFLGQYHTR